MSATDLVLHLVALFDQLAVSYMLVGSYSSNYYGRPRSTRDADFVVVLPEDKLSALRLALGPDFHFEPQMSFETITMTVRHVITHPATAFKIELFLLTDDPHDRSRFARRQRVDFEGYSTYLPTAEDVIIQKLRWSRGGKRAKDISDAAEVIDVQKQRLDLTYIRQWAAQHGTESLFEELLHRQAEAARREARPSHDLLYYCRRRPLLRSSRVTTSLFRQVFGQSLLET